MLQTLRVGELLNSGAKIFGQVFESGDGARYGSGRTGVLCLDSLPRIWK